MEAIMYSTSISISHPKPRHLTRPYSIESLSLSSSLTKKTRTRSQLPSISSLSRRGFYVNCNNSHTIMTESELEPVVTSIRSFGPATVANLGPGFDFIGVSVEGYGNMVTARVDPKVCPGKISISDISGPCATPELSRDPFSNPAGIAAAAVMEMLNIRSRGLSLSIEMYIPLNSGLGSEASIAAAAAASVNELFGKVRPVEDLVLAGLQSELCFSGYHVDNIAAALMGGFVMVLDTKPLDLKKLQFPAQKDLFFVLVVPELRVPARQMRQVLPLEIGMAQCAWNCCQAGALVAAVLEGDVKGLGKAMSADKIIEPRRAPFLPGLAAVKKAAIKAGAFGCTISGSGPTMVAVVEEKRIGMEVGKRMVEAFKKENLKADFWVTRLDRLGARRVSSVPISWW